MVCYKNDEGKYVDCNQFQFDETKIVWTLVTNIGEPGFSKISGRYGDDEVVSQFPAAASAACRRIVTSLKSCAAASAGWEDPPTPSPAAQ